MLWLFQGSKVPVKDAGCFSVSGVYFICPLTGKRLKKTEREARVKEAILLVGFNYKNMTDRIEFWIDLMTLSPSFLFLLLQGFSENPVKASIMMIHTFNKDREKVNGAIDIISK